MGTDTLDPFIDVCAETGGGVFVLVRTTNPGSPFLQHHGEPRAATRVADSLAEKGKSLTGTERHVERGCGRGRHDWR